MVLKVLPVDVVRMDFQDPQVQVETQVFLERLELLVEKVIVDQWDQLVAQDSLDLKDLADKAEILDPPERKEILESLVPTAQAERWDPVEHPVLLENVVLLDFLDLKERGDLLDLPVHLDPKEMLVKVVLPA